MHKTHGYSCPERTGCSTPQALHLDIGALQAVLADRLWGVSWSDDVGTSEVGRAPQLVGVHGTWRSASAMSKRLLNARDSPIAGVFEYSEPLRCLRHPSSK
jgi:hypothetical protein